jgi:hypothetical protein
MTSSLRIYTDVNSKANDAYWLLLYEGKRLDDVSQELEIYDGMPVVVYHEDEVEEFEWDGHLYHRPTGAPPAPQWVAVVDENSFRRIK